MRPPREFAGYVVLGLLGPALFGGSGTARASDPLGPTAVDRAAYPERVVALNAADAEAVARPAPSRKLGRLALTAGVRTDVVTSSGLDPFSDSDALPQSSLALRYLGSPRGGLGFGVGAVWDHGSFSSTARGAPTQLDTDRFSLMFEGRLPLWARLTGIARVAPGVLRRTARVTDPSIPNPPYSTASGLTAEQTLSAVSVDGSLGLDLLVAEARPLRGGALGFWLAGDAGYSYSPGRNVVLATSQGADSTANRTDAPVRLPQLALRGFFFRLAASVSF